MVIKIPKKRPYSNKVKTLPENSTEPPSASVTALPIQKYPAPFIDRISLVLIPPNQADAHDIYNLVMSSQDDKPSATNPTEGLFKDAGSKARWGGFKWAKRVVIPSVADTEKWPLLQLAYDKPLAKRIRIEFVPVDLGWLGMVELHSALVNVVPNGWDYFMHYGKITRLDVAVDFPALSPDDFCFLSQQGATSKEWRVNGSLTGNQHGKARGNQTAIYDRKVKRIAKGKSWIGKEGVRVERRIRVPPISRLEDLPTLNNPFAGMHLTGMPKGPPADSTTMSYVWDLFKRAVQVEGLPGALALLPEERRTLYRKHFAAHEHSWWDTEKIWEKWPSMLEELKIAAPNGLA